MFPSQARSWLPLVLAALGCSGAGEAAPTDPVDEPSTTAFAVSLFLSGTEDAAFVGLVDSLGPSSRVDLSLALEIPNNGVAFGPERGGVVFTVDGIVPRITRYEVGSNNTFVQGSTVSAEAVSVSTLRVRPSNFYFVSERRAYAIDTLSYQIIVWDPLEMVLVDTIDISELDGDGPGFISHRIVEREDEIVFTLAFLNETFGISPVSKIVFFNLSTETISRVITFDDCAGIQHIFLDGRGDLHASSDVASVANRLADRGGGPECLLRIPAGTSAVDRQVLIESVSDGLQGGSVFRQGDAGAYLRVLDESLVPPDAMSLPEFSSAGAWRWALIDLETASFVTLFDNLEPTASTVDPVVIGGRSFGAQTEPNLASSTLVELTNADGPVPGVTSPGVITGVFRVR
ncbi:MAG: hypothetical protein AAGF92_16905 [Myxococcota bacterium]